MRLRFLLPLLAAVPLLPAQTPLAWSLRQPFEGFGAAFATHPRNGNPVRFGGYNLSTGGVPDLWEWNGTRWLRHASLVQPPASGSGSASGFAMATDAQRGVLVLLAANSPATWTWDGRAWRSQPHTPLLQPRSDTAMAYDSARGRIVLFGGSNFSTGNNTLLGDTWEWDGTQWTPQAVGIAPPARAMHGLAYDAARGCTVLFGGGAPIANNPLGDTWEWNGTTWRQRFPAHAPVARSNMAMAYDPNRSRIVLHGGRGGLVGGYADTWEWDGTDWRQVTAPNAPSWAAAAAFVHSTASQRLVLFRTAPTAQVGSPDHGESVHEYDGTSWTPSLPTMPAVRRGGALVADPGRGEVILFGGLSISNWFADTWAWQGDAWRQLAPTVSPSARSGSGITYDAARGEVVLFGGGRATGSSSTAMAFDDTWTWQGNTWVQRTTPMQPSARSDHAFAYHAPTQQVVLFSGADANRNLLADTWLWNGSTWTQATPATSPPTRAFSAIAGTPQGLVLFGGSTWTTSTVHQIDLDDTWTWNGTTWVLVPTIHRPSARRLHAMTYDADRQKVLVFSGLPSPSQALAGDLWSFDGVDWTAEAAAGMPRERYGAHLAYDPARREVVLFGGVRTRDQNDTFTLGPAGAHTSQGTGCAGTLGAPTLVPNGASLPEPGGVAALDLDHLPQGLALVTMGFSATSTGGQALPLPLGPYGMPGCDLLVAPEAAQLVLGAGTAAAWSLPLPPAAALLGITFWNQMFAWDPAANAAGLTASNAVRTRIGH